LNTRERPAFAQEERNIPVARANPSRVAYGNAVLDRLAEVGVPPVLKEDHKVFKAQHTAFLTAHTAVAKAESTYDTAAAKVASLDAKRDKTILAIADKLPAAGLGERQSPFAAFSKYSPSRLTSLPYAAETNEVRALLSALAKAKPPAEIAKLCTQCAADNTAVDTALKALSAPLTILNEARAKRDAAIPDWEKHLRRLKDASKVAFREIAGRFDSVFAEPEAVQTNIRPKRRSPKTETVQEGAPADTAPTAPAKAKPRRRRK
jgi:hypothetical protein